MKHLTIHVLFLPMIVFTLIACNLSSNAGAASETLQIILTATPDTQSVSEALSEIAASESTASQAKPTVSQLVADVVSDAQVEQDDNLYYARGNRPQNQCAIQATVTTNIRTAGNTSATIIGQLVGGEWIPISRLVNGWYQIDSSTTPVHRMWISSDPTELDSLCRCDTNGCARSQTILTPNVNNNLYYVGNSIQTPPDICYVYTAGDFNVNIRAGQSETSKVLGQLRANQWIPVRHFINGWFGIIAPNTPVDGAYISSGPAILSSNCFCSDSSCTVNANATTCELTLHPNTSTKVHTEPSNWSSTVGELTVGETYTAVAQSTSGWYQLQVGGWVSPSYLKLLSEGGCRNLPRITYDAPVLKCDLVNTTPEIVEIVREPDGDYFGRFWPDHKLGVISRKGKWVQVYVAAFENAGWVDSTNMSLEGDCSNFQ